MENLREDIDIKLSHILHDIKELQKTIIHMKFQEKGVCEVRFSKWELLGKEISGKWMGTTVVEEIRNQREKRGMDAIVV